MAVQVGPLMSQSTESSRVTFLTFSLHSRNIALIVAQHQCGLNPPESPDPLCDKKDKDGDSAEGFAPGRRVRVPAGVGARQGQMLSLLIQNLNYFDQLQFSRKPKVF